MAVETEGQDQVEGTGATAEPEEQTQGGSQDEQAGEGTEGEGSDDGAADEVVVTIGEESPTSDEDENRAPEWVRELRKSNREKDRRIRELEEQAKASAPAAQATVLGQKPTLQSCEYDEERFDRELEAWHERKRVADAEEQNKRTAAEQSRKAWEARLENHSKLKSELKVKDFDDAEAAVEATFSVTQRGLIVHGADNSALLFYALGKNPQKAKELASISDPVKFAFAVAKLETQLKVQPRKNAPVPERAVRGNASTAGTVDSQLARLEAEADRTGDRSKVAAYRREKGLTGRR